MTNTIVIIDDDPSIREALLDMLEMEGFEGLEAESGVEGIRLARSRIPDLIICDVSMPELDGYSVLQALKQDPTTRAIPFIFLTANASRTDIQKGMNLGANAYLAKPFTQAKLLKAISAQLK